MARMGQPASEKSIGQSLVPRRKIVPAGGAALEQAGKLSDELLVVHARNVLIRESILPGCRGFSARSRSASGHTAVSYCPRRCALRRAASIT
jgi:hypothetical protein